MDFPRLHQLRSITIVLLLLGSGLSSAFAKERLRLGILAYRPKPQAIAQWQPLAKYLEDSLDKRVELNVYDLGELDTAVAQDALDVVLTTPGQYITFKTRYGLSAPLATQITKAGEANVTAFGGVIFARSDVSEISLLEDLAGKRIAVASQDLIGAYQMQARELLEAGQDPLSRSQLIDTGMPQDRAVAMVLDGKADVGFVRTGVLEAMFREGKLDMARVKIVHQQHLPNFPFISSTRLYPEWPIAAARGSTEAMNRSLALALLSYEPESEVARLTGIGGFAIPADYSSVEALMRSLRISPFEKTTELALTDFWNRYTNWIIALLGFMVFAFAAVGAQLVIKNGALRRSREQYRVQSQRVSEIIWGTNVGTWEWDLRTGEITLNDRWADIIGYSLYELSPSSINAWTKLIHPDDYKLSSSMVERCFRHEIDDYKCELRILHKNGTWVWVLHRGRVVEWSPEGKPLRMSGTQADITERKFSEQTLRASEKRFRDLFENSPDPCWLIKGGQFVDCNHAALTILGYQSREAILQHPSRLSPVLQPDGRPSSEKSEDMMRTARERGTHRFEWEHCREDLTCFPVEVTLSRFDPVDGDMLHCVWRDISGRKRAEKRQQHHNRILEMLIEKKTLSDVLNALVCDVQEVWANAQCCILLLEDGSKALHIGAAPSLPESFRDGLNQLGAVGSARLYGDTLFNAKRVVVDDLSSDPAWTALLTTAQRRQLTTCWSQPIVSALGKVIGVFSLFFPSSRGLTQEDIQRLEDEARLTALVIEKTTSEADLQMAASVFRHAREGIMIADAGGSIIDVNDTFTHITGYDRSEAIGQNPRILQSGRQDSDFYAQMWATISERGHWSGEVWNRRKNGEIYAEALTISAVRDSNKVAKNYVALFTDVTATKEQQRQLEHSAHYDALTGLPNRVLLADRLRQAMLHSQRRNQALAVVYLDLDGFKSVNDMHGHAVGDELLVALAHRMKSALRDGDTLARIGGDEFVAVIVDLEQPDDCEIVLDRLLQAAADPVLIDGHVLKVSASIGVTQSPQDGADADQLMRHADQAMYIAKLGGKNRFHHFDVAHDTAVKTQRQDLAAISQALEKREFVLFYQPKVNMKSGVIVGAEALIRWQHPERGLLPPAAFLPVIENHPISVELGEWVIDAALEQMEDWAQIGLSFPISVNVGVRQLQQGNFVERLTALLKAHPNVPPLSLELEVLETSAMEDINHVSEVMNACRALGVGFALDDFGTGYSSLTYLKHLPAELLKIDQSFVRDMLDDPDDLAIVEGVIGLATAFRRNVIAEGVESTAHGELLLTLGCELAQGYGIAKPMPAANIPGWVGSWHPNTSWTTWGERALSRDDKALVFVEVGHRHWFRSVEAFVRGESKTAPPLEASECHFGRWQVGDGQARFGKDPAFWLLVDLHERIHSEARTLVISAQLAPPMPQDKAIQELRALLDELTANLRNLCAQKAVS